MQKYIGLLGLLIAVGLAGCAALPPETATDSTTLAGRRAARLYTPTSETAMAALEVNRSFAGTPLNLDGYRVSFEDDFDTMSVTNENGNGPWYSPVHNDFGASHFVGPRAGQGPVLVRNGKLVIQMYKENGKWISSNVQSMDNQGRGFAQQYGYFEFKAKFPPMKGSWSGLWLHSHPTLTGSRVPQTEIDVVETYGGDVRGHHAGLHLWPVKDSRDGDVRKHANKGAYTKVDGLFDGFHTYGVLITPKEMIFYYDRKELERFVTLPEFKTPQYILMDLALLPQLSGHAEGVLEMEVDYVRVWQKNDGSGLLRP